MSLLNRRTLTHGNKTRSTVGLKFQSNCRENILFLSMSREEEEEKKGISVSQFIDLYHVVHCNGEFSSFLFFFWSKYLSFIGTKEKEKRLTPKFNYKRTI